MYGGGGGSKAFLPNLTFAWYSHDIGRRKEGRKRRANKEEGTKWGVSWNEKMDPSRAANFLATVCVLEFGELLEVFESSSGSSGWWKPLMKKQCRVWRAKGSCYPELLSSPHSAGCRPPACLQQVVALCLLSSAAACHSLPRAHNSHLLELRQTLSLLQAELHRSLPC